MLKETGSTAGTCQLHRGQHCLHLDKFGVLPTILILIHYREALSKSPGEADMKVLNGAVRTRLPVTSVR
jgi:hypothetical protein